MADDDHRGPQFVEHAADLGDIVGDRGQGLLNGDGAMSGVLQDRQDLTPGGAVGNGSVDKQDDGFTAIGHVGSSFPRPGISTACTTPTSVLVRDGDDAGPHAALSRSRVADGRTAGRPVVTAIEVAAETVWHQPRGGSSHSSCHLLAAVMHPTVVILYVTC